jgi:tetratricopeptide (TPR) repeat protein
MKKSLLLNISLLLFFPLFMHAQTATDLLRKVSADISAKQWDDAVVTFQKVIGLDVSRADIYYHTEVDKDCTVASRMAEDLAVYYKNSRIYDRAYSFYKELLDKKPNDISLLSGMAESAFGKGKEDEAVSIYEKIVSINPNNLRANIFIGSYYFMQSEKNKKQLDSNYNRLSSPSSMQRAHYKDQLKDLYSTSYKKSKSYLQKVIKLFPSSEAQKMLDTIEERNIEINS